MKKKYFKAIHQLITTGHWITDQVSKALKGHGSTEPQYNVLRILDAANGKALSVQEILEKMVQRNSNITRIVDKLIAKGCVERKECPSNRRKMDITLTKDGKAFLETLDEKVHQLHKPLMKNLSSDELDTLRKLIKKLTANN